MPWQGSTTRDADTGAVIKSVPVHLAKLAFNYRNAPIGLLAVVTGNYAWLNSEDYHLAEYKPIIWNLSLTQKLLPGNELSPEIFFPGTISSTAPSTGTTGI